MSYDKVQAGERIRAFLADEYVQFAFKAIERQAMAEFKQAKTDEQLRRAQALSWAVDTVAGMMVQMVDEGTHARNDQA